MIRWPIRQAACTIQQGGIIAYPTETLYGLGCDPLCLPAIQRLLAIKQRPLHKGFILLAGQPAQLFDFIEPLPEIQRLLANPCDEPTTWIVPAATSTPEWLTGGRATLAVRVSPHPVVKALCRSIGFPLVSTSANSRGGVPISQPYRLRKKLGDRLDTIVPGHINRYAKPSRMIDACSGEIIRSG